MKRTAAAGDPILVTGKGYKDGTTVTFWRDEMTPVMWNKDGSSTDNDDKVWLLLSDKEEYKTVVEATPKRGSHALPLPATDNTLMFDDDDNSGTVRVKALVAPNGAKDSNEERLCSAIANGQDIASCEFEVTNPPFVGGDISNYVNGVDGRGNPSHENGNDDQRFLLLPSISATPNGGSPGEVMLVQLADFPVGASVTRVELSRRHICGGDRGERFRQSLYLPGQHRRQRQREHLGGHSQLGGAWQAGIAGLHRQRWR